MCQFLKKNSPSFERLRLEGVEGVRGVREYVERQRRDRDGRVERCKETQRRDIDRCIGRKKERKKEKNRYMDHGHGDVNVDLNGINREGVF